MQKETTPPKNMTRHECPFSNKDIREVQELTDTLAEMMASMNQIKDAVIGNEFNDGFKQRIQRLEKDNQTTKKIQWGIIGVGTFLGLVSGFRSFVDLIQIAHLKEVLVLPFLYAIMP